MHDRDLWWGVLKNVRAGIMPPAGKPRPTAEEVRTLEDWIKRDVFGIDPTDPDPGRVTIRRLNRVEYRNTIRDLMGIDFQADEEFPADDTGYGFDNIGDVLSVSPLLLEKYMQAAETIVKQAVPTVSAVVADPDAHRGPSSAGPTGSAGERLSFYKAGDGLARPSRPSRPGTYRLAVELTVRGAFDFDPGRCQGRLQGGRPRAADQGVRLGGRQDAPVRVHRDLGARRPPADLRARTADDARGEGLVGRPAGSPRCVVEGPLRARALGPARRTSTGSSSRTTPGPTAERRAYAREVLARFARKAYRRPVDDRTLDRLVAIAEAVYAQPGKTVEQGMAEAMVAVLASPRFLFRVEEVEPDDRVKAFARVDEYALASRLSYFLWSTMPDDELFAPGRPRRAAEEPGGAGQADAGRPAVRGAGPRTSPASGSRPATSRGSRSTPARSWRATAARRRS